MPFLESSNWVNKQKRYLAPMGVGVLNTLAVLSSNCSFDNSQPNPNVQVEKPLPGDRQFDLDTLFEKLRQTNPADTSRLMHSFEEQSSTQRLKENPDVTKLYVDIISKVYSNSGITNQNSTDLASSLSIQFDHSKNIAFNVDPKGKIEVYPQLLDRIHLPSLRHNIWRSFLRKNVIDNFKESAIVERSFGLENDYTVKTAAGLRFFLTDETGKTDRVDAINDQFESYLLTKLHENTGEDPTLYTPITDITFVARFKELFALDPQLEKIFMKYHQNSQPLELAKYIGNLFGNTTHSRIEDPLAKGVAFLSSLSFGLDSQYQIFKDEFQKGLELSRKTITFKAPSYWEQNTSRILKTFN